METKDYLKSTLGLWQEYAKAYTDFVVEAMEQNVKAALALRQRLDQMAAEISKQAQALSAQEQEIVLQAADSIQTQTRAVSERLSRVSTPPAK